jgi:hypothetical protein
MTAEKLLTTSVAILWLQQQNTNLSHSWTSLHPVPEQALSRTAVRTVTVRYVRSGHVQWTVRTAHFAEIQNSAAGRSSQNVGPSTNLNGTRNPPLLCGRTNFCQCALLCGRTNVCQCELLLYNQACYFFLELSKSSVHLHRPPRNGH